MTRPGVTYQDIASAAEELKSKGQNITIGNIRGILGTGSIGTINKYLREWRLRSSQNITTQENVPEELGVAMKRLWERVQAEALQKFQEREAEYQQEITELKSELSKYKENNQRWQKLFNQWQQEKIALANEKLTLEQALEFAHKENQSLRHQSDSISQQLHDREERIQELHQLHKQTQANLEHYRESTREQRILEQQQFERDKQLLQNDVKNISEQLLIKQTQFLHLEQDKQLLQHTYIELEKKFDTLTANVETCHHKIQELEKSNSENFQMREHWKNQHDRLAENLEKQRNELIAFQSENKLLSQQQNESKSMVKYLQDQNKLLASEKWELSQDKARLEGELKQIEKSLVS